MKDIHATVAEYTADVGGDKSQDYDSVKLTLISGVSSPS